MGPVSRRPHLLGSHAMLPALQVDMSLSCNGWKENLRQFSDQGTRSDTRER
jgi:hypothetical protein